MTGPPAEPVPRPALVARPRPPRPAPAVADTRAAVRAGLADLARDCPGALVLVGCSGGADSLALAAAAGFVAPRCGLRAGAVVVDHALQPGSDRVAARTAAVCRDLGLHPVEVVAVAVPAGAGGPEAAARGVRHHALAAAATRHGARAVLLGHTRDDQAETVLLRLARGAGARSLAGIAPVRGLLRRPLLALPRERTAAACAAQGLLAWSDPANADARLTRSRLRRDALPVLREALGPGLDAALARTAEMLRQDADTLDDLAADLLTAARGSAARESAAEGVVLRVAALETAPAALRHRALHRAALLAGARAGALSRHHVLAVDALVTGWHGQGPVQLPGGVVAARGCGRLTLR